MWWIHSQSESILFFLQMLCTVLLLRRICDSNITTTYVDVEPSNEHEEFFIIWLRYVKSYKIYNHVSNRWMHYIWPFQQDISVTIITICE